MLALTNQLKAIEVPLADLFLDPNNPRFVESDWTYVPDSDIDDVEVQDRIARRLLSNFGADKLRMNMEVNGYLPIDRVIAREFKPGKYVVLEGNRRICAAKQIKPTAADGTSISVDVIESLKSIPVLQYTGGDTNAAWIFQGLRHISGVEDWSAYNKAKLLVEQMEADDISLTEVGRRFGLTPHGAGQWVRGYYAFKQAREESDFISEVNELSYPYFQELFSRSSTSVREWLEWNESSKRFDNGIRFNEFVSWLYPREETEAEGQAKGEWEKRRIARRDDIRDLAQLISEEREAFEEFRQGSQLEVVYSMALARKFEKEAKEKANPVEEVFQAIRNCCRALESMPLKVVKEIDLRLQLDALISELESKIAYVK